MVPFAPPLTQHVPKARLWLLSAVVAAVAVHAVDLYQFESFEFDKVNQVSATASWLQGRGFTIPDVAAAGLPHAVYRPLLGFPPGYALALAPIMRLTGDIWWSTYLLDVFGQAVFIVAWAAVIYAATGSASLAAGLVLMWTVVFSPVAAATYSDLLALSLFSAALAAGTLSTTATGRAQWIAATASAMLVAAACVTRYAYWPLAIVMPGAIVAARRDRTSWFIASAHLVVVAAAIAVTAVFMQRTTGEALFLSRWYPDQVRGFYWSHLLALNPFAADALGTGRLYALIAKGRGVLERSSPLVVWMLSALCLAVAASYVIDRVRRAFARRLDAHEIFFDAAGVLTCAATIAMNLWLTLRLPATSDGWTVGGEPRYYMPALPFIGAWIWLAAGERSFGGRRTRAVASAAIAAAIAVSVPVRLIRVQRYLTKNVETAWMAEGRREQASVIEHAIHGVRDGVAPPLFVDDSPKWRRYVATMNGALVVTPAAIRRCAGGAAGELRFLMSLRRDNDASPGWSATRVGRVEDVDLVSIVGAPCAPANSEP